VKTRKGFVSNSSSTNFICDICGHKERAWDSTEPEALGFRRCTDEGDPHLYCPEHAKDFVIPESLHLPEWADPNCPICTFQTISIWDMKRYLKALTKIPEADVFAEIKKVNKRRRKLYDFEYIEHALRSLDKTEEQMVQELREAHGSLEKFQDFVRGMK
jgi:hypothetical protein